MDEQVNIQKQAVCGKEDTGKGTDRNAGSDDVEKAAWGNSRQDGAEADERENVALKGSLKCQEAADFDKCTLNLQGQSEGIATSGHKIRPQIVEGVNHDSCHQTTWKQSSHVVDKKFASQPLSSSRSFAASLSRLHGAFTKVRTNSNTNASQNAPAEDLNSYFPSQPSTTPNLATCEALSNENFEEGEEHVNSLRNRLRTIDLSRKWDLPTPPPRPIRVTFSTPIQKAYSIPPRPKKNRGTTVVSGGKFNSITNPRLSRRQKLVLFMTECHCNGVWNILKLLAAMFAVMLISVTMTIVISVLTNRDTTGLHVDDGFDSDDTVETMDTLFAEPLLETIKKRGFLRCQAFAGEVLFGEGFTVDLCLAIAAAIFNDSLDALNHTEFTTIPFAEQFAALWNGLTDVSTDYTSYTMQREVFEPSTGKGMQFSSPFLFQGVVFSGIPEFVECAELNDTQTRNCSSLSICVESGTSTEEFVSALLPTTTTSVVVSAEETIRNFLDGSCNVIFGKPSGVNEQLLQIAGYTDEFVFGEKIYSRDPVALTSKGDDLEWADFCNWILRALITAESLNITQEIALVPSMWTSHAADTLLEPDYSPFGDDYRNMFRSAVAAVGNYGELYERHFEPFHPRSTNRVNTINLGDSGLLFTFPFGGLLVDDSYAADIFQRAGPIPGGALAAILSRGILRCGVVGSRPGFATEMEFENATRDNAVSETYPIRWTGLDTEYCRALSAALFEDAPASSVNEDSRIEFVDVGNVTNGYIKLHADEVDLLVGGSISLTADVKEESTGKGFTFTQPYYYFNVRDGDVEDKTNVLNKQMSANGIGYSLVTQEHDWQWSAFVRWVSLSLFYAEQTGITRENAMDMPVVELFGSEFLEMFRSAVLAVGNYGEMFNRTLTGPYDVQRQGRNLLNVDGDPQFVAMNL